MAQTNQALNSAQEHAASFMDKIKAWWANSGLAEKFQASKYTLAEVGVFFVFGLIAGVMFKKYLKYILLLVLFMVSLIIMEQFDLVSININWQKIQELVSFKAVTLPQVDASLVDAYWQWIKENALMVISASIGFVLGLKLG